MAVDMGKPVDVPTGKEPNNVESVDIEFAENGGIIVMLRERENYDGGVPHVPKRYTFQTWDEASKFIGGLVK